MRVGGQGVGPWSIRQVLLVEGDNVGDASLFKEGEELPVRCLQPLCGVRYEDGYVALAERFSCALHPQLSEGPLVVDARGVDDDHRPQGQEFHRL